MNGALDLTAVRTVASAGSGVIGTVNFLDVALGILHDIRTGHKIGITQPHLLPGSQTVVLLRRIEAEVITVDVEFPGEGNLAGTKGIVIRIQRHLKDIFLILGVIIDNKPDGIKHRHPARSMGVEIFADAEFKQPIFNHSFRLGHSDPLAKITNGFRRNTPAAQGAQGGHSRVVPPLHISFLHKLDELAFGKHRIGEVEAGKFRLLGMVYVQRLQHPVVQFPVIHELQGAERMRDTLYGVAQRMREIVHGVDAPLVTRAVMRGMTNPVQGGIAHDQIGRRHVDLRAQHVCTIREFTSAHAPEEVEILLDGAVSIGALPARLSQGTSVLTDFISAKVVYIRLSHFNELLSVLVQLVEIIGSVEFTIAPVTAGHLP